MSKTKQKYNLESLIAKKTWYYKNSYITSANFPVPEIIETENPQIVKMDSSFSSEKALKIIKEKGLRPANIYELAIFANEHPEAFPDGKWTSVLAFGSDYTDSLGDHWVPYVYARDDGDFRFFLGFFGLGWGSDHCLLCFCDKSSDTQTLSKPESGYKVIKEI